MRRPLKPFVTEYKPSTRRQLAPTRQPQSFATETAKPVEGGRFDNASRSDDSYEAVMRAADALFSPQKDRAQPSSEYVGDDLAETNGSRDAGRGVGRILRAVDEPSRGPMSERMDELEREHAPKRRGRKPGSKNKPKPDRPMVSGLATVVTASDARSADSQSMPASSVDGTAGSAAAHDQAVGSDDSEHDRLFQEQDAREPEVRDQGDGPRAVAGDAASHVMPLPSRARRRFSWVRTKLKPGQEWKRRLPKVCW